MEHSSNNYSNQLERFKIKQFLMPAQDAFKAITRICVAWPEEKPQLYMQLEPRKTS